MKVSIKLPANHQHIGGKQVRSPMCSNKMDERELISAAIKLLVEIPGNLYPAFDNLIVEARNKLEDALKISAFDKQYKSKKKL